MTAVNDSSTNRAGMRGWQGFESGKLPEPRPINMHAPWLLIIVAVPLLGGLSFGLLQSIWMAISSGNPGEPLGEEGWSLYVIFAWIVVLILLVIMLGVLLLIVTIGKRLTTSRVIRWFFFMWSGTTLADAGSIEYRQQSDAVFGRAPAQIVILNKNGGIESSYSSQEIQWLQVIANVREWVRARPDLIQDNLTRSFFDELETY